MTAKVLSLTEKKAPSPNATLLTPYAKKEPLLTPALIQLKWSFAGLAGKTNKGLFVKKRKRQKETMEVAE